MPSIRESIRSCEPKFLGVGLGVQDERREIPESDMTKGDASNFEQS